MNQLILITLLLSKLLNAIVYPSFNPEIQTGNFTITPGNVQFSSFVANQYVYNVQITFVNANNTDYAYAVALSGLSHSNSSSDKYSVSLNASNILVYSMNLQVKTNLSVCRIQRVSAVWLIVSNSFTYLNIAHFSYKSPNITDGTAYSQEQPLQVNNSTSFSMQNTDYFFYAFSGFKIKSAKNNLMSIRVDFKLLDGRNYKMTFSHNQGRTCFIYSVSVQLLVFKKNSFMTDYSANFIYGSSKTITNLITSQTYRSNSVGSTIRNVYSNPNTNATLLFYGLNYYKTKSYIDWRFAFTSPNLTLNLLNIEQYARASYFFFSYPKYCTGQLSCLTCNTSSYINLAYSQCISCSNVADFCLSCSNSTTCQTCLNQYTIDNSGVCTADCSLISECYNCSVTNFLIICRECFSGYQLISNQCFAICGDARILGDEECDDNNTNNGDGCSSTCIQEEYYTCENIPSDCKLKTILMQVVCVVKKQFQNKFTLTIHIKPQNTPSFKDQKWISIFQNYLNFIHPQRLLQNNFNSSQKVLNSLKTAAYSVTPLSSAYDPNSNRLRTLFQYYDSLEGQIFTLGLSFSQLSSIFQKLVPLSIAFPQNTQNNLSLYAFTEDHYKFALIIKYLSFSVAVLSLILFIAGYFGAKIIAIECLGVVQVTTLLLMTLKKMSPTFSQLKYLNLTLGISGFQQQYYHQSSTLPIHSNSVFFGRNPLASMNIFWLLIFGPLIVAAILKILSLTNCKQKKIIHNGWKNALGTYTYYGIFFLAYGQFASLALNLRFYQSQTASILAISFGILFFLLILVYVILSHKYPKWFGSFKNKFYRYEISEYYFTFSALQRFLTALLVVCVGPTYISGLIPSILFLLEIFFICIKKPYLKKLYIRRSFLKKVTAIIICGLFSVTSFISVQSTLNMFLPLIILVLLLAIVIYSSVIAVIQIRANYIQIVSDKKYDEIYQQENESQIKVSFEQTQKILLKQIEMKMIPKEQYINAILQQKTVQHETVDLDKWRWDHYTHLYSYNATHLLHQKTKKSNGLQWTTLTQIQS